jgi:hypothetical protein
MPQQQKQHERQRGLRDGSPPPQYAWVFDGARGGCSGFSSSCCGAPSGGHPPSLAALELCNASAAGGAAAVLGMPDAAALPPSYAQRQQSSDWRLQVATALVNDPAWAPPRLVSASRLDPGFSPSRRGYGGPCWIDIMAAVAGALASPAASAGLGGGAGMLIASALAAEAASQQCGAWQLGEAASQHHSPFLLPVQTSSSSPSSLDVRRQHAPLPPQSPPMRFLSAAFDAATDTPLANSTRAYRGGGTGLALPAYFLLALRPAPAIPPIPGKSPSFNALIIAMTAQLAVVAAVALGCAILGGSHVRHLTSRKTFLQEQQQQQGALFVAVGSLNSESHEGQGGVTFASKLNKPGPPPQAVTGAPGEAAEGAEEEVRQRGRCC